MLLIFNVYPTNFVPSHFPCALRKQCTHKGFIGTELSSRVTLQITLFLKIADKVPKPEHSAVLWLTSASFLFKESSFSSTVSNHRYSSIFYMYCVDAWTLILFNSTHTLPKDKSGALKCNVLKGNENKVKGELPKLISLPDWTQPLNIYLEDITVLFKITVSVTSWIQEKETGADSRKSFSRELT